MSLTIAKGAESTVAASGALSMGVFFTPDVYLPAVCALVGSLCIILLRLSNHEPSGWRESLFPVIFGTFLGWVMAMTFHTHVEALVGSVEGEKIYPRLGIAFVVSFCSERIGATLHNIDIAGILERILSKRG